MDEHTLCRSLKKKPKMHTATAKDYIPESIWCSGDICNAGNWLCLG